MKIKIKQTLKVWFWASKSERRVPKAGRGQGVQNVSVQKQIGPNIIKQEKLYKCKAQNKRSCYSGLGEEKISASRLFEETFEVQILSF